MNDVRQTIIKVIRFGGVLLFGCIGLYACVRIGQYIYLPLLEEREPTPVPIVYEIETLPSEWEILWETQSIRLKTPIYGLSLVASSENALALTGPVTKINLLTGTTTTCPISSIQSGMLVANETHFFVDFLGTTTPISRNSTWGAARIEAYAIESCHQVWSKSIPGTRKLNVIFAAETTVSTYGSGLHNNYLLDAATGDILDRLPQQESAFIWKTVEEENIIYIRTPQFPLTAINRDTGEIVWQSPIGYGIEPPPIFTDRIIIARAATIRDRDRLIAISRDTGDLLWEVENVRSNVALGGDHIFLISRDMQLVALDPMTGTIISQVSFIPNKAIATSSNIFQVAASDDIVVVYLGDGNQLMAFRFSSDG